MHSSYRVLTMIACCLLLPGSASALTTRHLGSDQEMLDLMIDPHFVAGGQIGNAGANGIPEIELGRDPDVPTQIADYRWTNGAPVAFTLEYDGAGLVQFTVGQMRLYYSPARGFRDIFVRTRSRHEATGVSIHGLVLDGVVLSDVVAAGGSDGLDILWIQGGMLDDGFRLDGKVTFSWPQPGVTNLSTAFQIRVGASNGATSVDPTSWSRVKARFRD